MSPEAQEKLGTDAIEKCMELAAKNIVLGAKIAKDGVNANDIVLAPQAFENIKELVEFIASKPEVLAQIKDVDPMEGLALLKKGYDLYVEVKEELKEEAQ